MKLLSRRERQTPDIRSDSLPALDPRADVESEFLPCPLSDEYALTIHACLTQQGVEHDELRVSVRTVGASPSGMDVYAGFIKVLRWTPAVRALMVPPLPAASLPSNTVTSACLRMRLSRIRPEKRACSVISCSS